jgi:hypothetical protein
MHASPPSLARSLKQNQPNSGIPYHIKHMAVYFVINHSRGEITPRSYSIFLSD